MGIYSTKLHATTRKPKKLKMPTPKKTTAGIRGVKKGVGAKKTNGWAYNRKKNPKHNKTWGEKKNRKSPFHRI